MRGAGCGGKQDAAAGEAEAREAQDSKKDVTLENKILRKAGEMIGKAANSPPPFGQWAHFPTKLQENSGNGNVS